VAERASVPERSGPASESRRRLLGWLTGGIVTGIAAAVAVPGVRMLVGSTLKRRGADTVQLGKLADFPMGEPKLAQFTLSRTDGWVTTLDTRGVWVVRTGDQDATVFSGRCTHLGCAYSWMSDASRFHCPCHDGVFTLDGTVQSGPPPRRLDTLPVQVNDGALVIQYQDFRLGVPNKAPL
jgi:quinol---cytochrome c reductase iron-sulfur subunit, bacillus type